jgi:tetratricopeptide (TPR) repeat protein
MPPRQASEADVFVAHAVVAYDEGRFEDALAFLRQALELAPDHVDAIYHTGLTLLAMGRTDEAIASFERLLALQPDDEAALFQFGLAHSRMATTTRRSAHSSAPSPSTPRGIASATTSACFAIAPSTRCRGPACA